MAVTGTTLVIGATGHIGRNVVTGLRARDAAVRAMSRSPDTAALPGGVETVAGDLTDPGTLRGALDGVERVFLLWPFLSAEGAPAVIDTIAGQPRRVVYVSAMGADAGGVWGQVEAAIRDTALDWTFLRPGGFATNTLGWAAEVRAGGPVRIPYPGASRSLIHERDIADVAVRALTEEGHSRRTYVLTGPAALTQADQVRILADVAGTTARAEEITAREARAGMLAWADPGFADSALAYWASLVDTPEPVTDTVERLTGAPARGFAQWARDHAEDFL